MSKRDAKRIRDSILADVCDRRGWAQEWDQFDEDIQDEIKSEWLRIIEYILVPAKPKKRGRK